MFRSTATTLAGVATSKLNVPLAGATIDTAPVAEGDIVQIAPDVTEAGALKLPSAIGGTGIMVANASAVAVEVFPWAANEVIGPGAPGAAASVAPKTAVLFFAVADRVTVQFASLAIPETPPIELAPPAPAPAPEPVPEPA